MQLRCSHSTPTISRRFSMHNPPLLEKTICSLEDSWYALDTFERVIATVKDEKRLDTTPYEHSSKQVN